MEQKSNNPLIPKRVLTGGRIHYICPKCNKNLELRLKWRKNECRNCGARLTFEPLEKQWFIEWIICNNRNDAIRCTEKYNEITKYDFFDPKVFAKASIQDNKNWPKEMCFLFLDPKDHGRFIRWAAKDDLVRLVHF